MENIVRFGMMKALPRKYDLEYNMALFERMAKKASDNDVNILLTCECFLDGYCVYPVEDFDKKRFANEITQSRDGKIISRVREIAKDYRMHIVFGYSENSSGKFRNAAIFIDDEGREIGSYYKVITLDHDSVYTPGDDFPVFTTRYGKFGILICADRRWPEHARILKLKGAQALLMPTYGMYHQKNQEWMQTRAYENEMWLMFNHARQVFIYNPNGDLEAKYESNVDDLLIHDVYLNLTCTENKLDNRKPGLYSELCK